MGGKWSTLLKKQISGNITQAKKCINRNSRANGGQTVSSAGQAGTTLSSKLTVLKAWSGRLFQEVRTVRTTLVTLLRCHVSFPLCWYLHWCDKGNGGHSAGKGIKAVAPMCVECSSPPHTQGRKKERRKKACFISAWPWRSLKRVWLVLNLNPEVFNTPGKRWEVCIQHLCRTQSTTSSGKACAHLLGVGSWTSFSVHETPFLLEERLTNYG